MEFFWISGALWLDLVNSEWMSAGARVDGWRDKASLQGWLREAGARFGEAGALRDGPLGAAVSGEVQDEGEALLDAARALRAALRAACEATHGGRAVPPDALAALNAILAQRGVIMSLEATVDGWRERETLESSATLSPLWIVARSAARSWSGGELARLRPCANPACILWFLDSSKNGTRRWCSMQACGNRHKVTAHYERRTRRTKAED